jgi:hypothetical protein
MLTSQSVVAGLVNIETCRKSGILIGSSLANSELIAYKTVTGTLDNLQCVPTAISACAYRYTFQGLTRGVGSTSDLGWASGATAELVHSISNAGTLGFVAAGDSAFVSLVSAGSEALCHRNAGAGNVEEITDCAPVQMADYAEIYPMAEDVMPGDIVEIDDIEVTTMDGDPMRRLRKAATPYARGIVGVVSDPAKATDFNVIGYNIRAEDHPMPLALNGRLMVTVSTENGPIAPGDPITASSEPGVGMKATEPGMIVGFAIHDYSDLAPGRVMVMINPSWWDDDAAAASATIPPGVIMETERGIEVTADLIAIRDDSLASTVTTGPDGVAVIHFTSSLGDNLPVASLTVLGSQLAFAQVETYLQDASGAWSGMRVKTFGPSGAPLGGVTLQYIVVVKPE